MSRISFDNYGRRAKSGMSFTEMAGRHEFQRGGEALIIPDVIGKLGLAPDDDLLEIGCGAGNLLIPLSFWVRSVTGIDNADCLAALRARFDDPRVATFEGNFLDLAIDRRYSKILVYSVVHLLADAAEVAAFVGKAASLLVPGGSLLIGDVPNQDKMARFNATERGRAVRVEYERQREANRRPNTGFTPEPDNRLVSLAERDVLELVADLRRKGYEAFVLPQPEGLPFCYTREDILVNA